MERTLAIPIGVIVGRRKSNSPCQDHGWHPTSIFLGTTNLYPGSRMRSAGDMIQYFAGTSDLNLYATDTHSYKANLEQQVPFVYVVLQIEDTEPIEFPPFIHLLTAAPDEAESYFESNPDRVGVVEMPRQLVDLLATFVAAHGACGSDDNANRAKSGWNSNASHFSIKEP